MLNILYINCDRGAGVEFEGNLFLEIMKRVKGIDSITISKGQHYQIYKTTDYEPYDLIITNDFTFEDAYYDSFCNVKKPFINISFGGSNHNAPFVDLVIDINHFYTLHTIKEHRNYANINFISGNIWHDYTKWENRSDDVLYVGRFNDSKIIEEFLDAMVGLNKKVNFYGTITDEDYYDKWKHVINYHGHINHKELLKVYNDYKTIYLFSTTECLSMTVREAILCGTVPIVYDDCNYTTLIEPYVVSSSNIIDISYAEKALNVKERIVKDNAYLNNLLSFDKMILDFLTCLRNVTLKDLKFDKEHEVPCEYINEGSIRPVEYEMDTVDWNNVNL